MLRQLRIHPPLAFARLGNSRTPLEAFDWGPNDNSPRGTGKTTITPASTLSMAPDGTITARVPESVRFKDESGLRPVCPFFELHGEWDPEDGPGPGALTPERLARFGLEAARLRWRVEVANLKAYFMTRDWQARIHACVELRGDDVRPRRLKGRSPEGAEAPLVPRGRHIPLGEVRLSRPTDEFPEFRLRFTPGRGRLYGPENLLERWNVSLPRARLFLNPRSAWSSWRPGPDDPRGKPDGQYAQDAARVSLGIVDDSCDGIIRCWVEGTDLPPAHARIVVGPPDYAPDRRPLVSLADGLKDRVGRHEIFEPGYLDGDPVRTEAEVLDLMERAFETAGLINLDVFNNRVDVQENREVAIAKGIPYKESDHYAFEPPAVTPGDPLPLTDRAREHHRRLVVAEVLVDMLSKRPGFLERLVRPPLSPDPFFTAQMPALMRGASGHPLHLTRRQYDLLLGWARWLQGRGGSR